MKRASLFFLFAVILSAMTNAQRPDYTREWKRIDSLSAKAGLTKSALAAVKEVYNAAAAEKNQPQILKSLIYQVLLGQHLEEDATITSIRLLEKQLPILNEPGRSILNSIIAENYWHYFRANRWKMYNRAAADTKSDDPETWSAAEFHSTITRHYLASLKNERLLQTTALNGFAAILEQGNTRWLRPTLFDFLAHRALDYFTNDERTVLQPANHFSIVNDTAFAPAAEFVKVRFKTEDTTSLYFRSLVLFQKLLKLHLNDTLKDALIDADIRRIEFVKAHAQMQGKDQLYYDALSNITATYPDNRIAAQAWYLRASVHAQKARQYQPLENDSNRYEWNEAEKICERVVARADSSEGKTNCINLLSEIRRKDLSLVLETANIPGAPFRALTGFRNFSRLYIRVIKADTAIDNLNNSGDIRYWQQLTALPTLTGFEQVLPETGDHQFHTTEIRIPALQPGKYALLVSPDKNFTPGKSVMAVHSFHVTNIAFVKRGENYFALNRQTGAPLQQAPVRTWFSQYDYTARKMVLKKGPSLKTDNNGTFTLDRNPDNNQKQFRFEISTGDDYFFPDNVFYHYYSPEKKDPEENKTSYLFTDRAIYRPGQTLFFKGIVVSSIAGGKPTAATNFTTTVFLHDANGQAVDSMEVTTNAYGSYNGTFRLPAGGLSGNFEIIDQGTGGVADFSVEEYKRPRFQVTLADPAKRYVLNDSVSINGEAVAYAGNAIDGARVNYSVVRTTSRFQPYPLARTRTIYPPVTNRTIIANGTVTTDKNGKFTLTFKALPDDAVARRSGDMFNYEIQTDITDNSGETRSANKMITIGYQSVRLLLEAPSNMPLDSLQQIKAKAVDLNNNYQSVPYSLRLVSLKAPDRLLRERLWQQPDIHVLPEDEYIRSFPFDIYKRENEPVTWPAIKTVATIQDSTQPDGKVRWPGNVQPGWYLLEMSTPDPSGEIIKDSIAVLLYRNDLKSPLAGATLMAATRTAEPGRRIPYRLSTNLDSLYIIRSLSNSVRSDQYDYSWVTKQNAAYELWVSDNDLGGMEIDIAFVKHNRFYSDNISIEVPYPGTDLNISYSSFRDKLLPGSPENWTIHISGSDKEKVTAELLATMYDASLDAFRPHPFNKPAVWPRFAKLRTWESHVSFGTGHGNVLPEPLVYVSFRKEYDRLISPREEGLVSSGLNQKIFGMRAARTESLEQDMASAPTAAFAQDSAETTPAPEPVPQVRSNLQETAFFFPELYTDSSGDIRITFTIPEALTTWKFRALAHTPSLAFGASEKTIVTSKDLMVQPNAPRFVRAGDGFDFSGKIVNMTDKELTGQVELQLIDPTTDQPVDGWFKNVFPNQFFTVEAGQSVPVSFTVEIPYQYNKLLRYRMVARSENKSDGEEGLLPVLSNRHLVTESIQLPIRGSGTKQFSFPKLLNSGDSETLNHHSLTVEFTSNPVWLAIQALPYLAEQKRPSSDELFNTFYANALASAITKDAPEVRKVLQEWNSDTNALLSNLEKNQELKSTLVSETPWVLQARSEAAQRKQIAAFYDTARVQFATSSALQQLAALQSPNGGFMWFPGGPDDRFITQYIMAGLGHLTRFETTYAKDPVIRRMITLALQYLDKSIQADYELDLKNAKKGTTPSGINNLQIQYLYIRSFFSDRAISGSTLKAYAHYRKQAAKDWLKHNRYMQSMIAIALHRSDDLNTARKIVASLKQNAINNPELGMYWKDVKSGYYWHQAPVETQSVMIEAFSEIARDTKSVADMRTWLLKQKQTKQWNTSRATADAVYALLLTAPGAEQGRSTLTKSPEVKITLGGEEVVADRKQAGTGYFKKIYTENQVNPRMGNVVIDIKEATGAMPAWGAVYWQYFENLEAVTASNGAMQVTKQLFKEITTAGGTQLTALNDNNVLNIGDKIKVRLILKADRDMEYLHLKDMRAAGTEPVNVLSSYKWQGGLGYYESTGDAATNFYFTRVPRGTYVFEYNLFVTHTGKFNNGIATLQSVYAPEFSSHTGGMRITVE